MYGKQTETAIAAVSYLAALWDGPSTRRVSAADIADGRGLQRPFVAKLLAVAASVVRDLLLVLSFVLRFFDG